MHGNMTENDCLSQQRRVNKTRRTKEKTATQVTKGKQKKITVNVYIRMLQRDNNTAIMYVCVQDSQDYVQDQCHTYIFYVNIRMYVSRKYVIQGNSHINLNI